MTTNFFPANLQWLGIAKETTYGTAIATPSIFIPMISPKWTPKITGLDDQALRGSMAKTYGHQQGLRYDEFSYSTYPYMDSIYPHLLAILGAADTITGSADPYTHKTALYNGSGTNAAQPPSYTLFYFDAAGKCWQAPGCMAASVEIDAKAESLVGVAVTWMGLPATAITPPSNTPTANPPIPSWNSTITVGGTAMTKYSEFKVALKRAAEMIPTITGTQSPFAIFSGELDVTATLTGIYQNSTDNDLAAFLANTQPAALLKIAPAGDAIHSLTLQMSKVAYNDTSITGNKWMEVSSNLTALANTTDAIGGGYSPAQAIFLTNTGTAF